MRVTEKERERDIVCVCGIYTCKYGCICICVYAPTRIGVKDKTKDTAQGKGKEQAVDDDGVELSEAEARGGRASKRRRVAMASGSSKGVLQVKVSIPYK